FHATMVSTVSPTYAREVMTWEGGAGLDGLLRHRHFDVHGILNGLDCEVWDPSADRHLAATFTADTLERRAENKRALQQRAGRPAWAPRGAAGGDGDGAGRAEGAGRHRARPAPAAQRPRRRGAVCRSRGRRGVLRGDAAAHGGLPPPADDGLRRLRRGTGPADL